MPRPPARRWRALALLALVLALVGEASSQQCYLEDPDAECAVCWTRDATPGANGTTSMPSPCGPGLQLAFDSEPPAAMLAGRIYSMDYTLTVDLDEVAVVPWAAEGDGDSASPRLWQVQHANIHACRLEAGACTPFLPPSDLVTHTGALAGELGADGSATLSSSLALNPPGVYTIIVHIRIFTTTPRCNINAGDACPITERNIAMGLRRTVAMNMARQLSSQCYLEDPNATCAMCWTTNSAGEEDLAACPLSILLQFDTALPQQLEEGRGYEVEYSLMIDTSKVPVVAMTPPGGMPAEITHANIHSCFSRIGTCTPFVEDTPGLSTHTSADTALLDADGYAAFSADLELEAGLYTIIAHLRFYTLDDDVPSPVGGCEGKDCLKVYDVAVGSRRRVILASQLPAGNPTGVPRSDTEAPRPTEAPPEGDPVAASADLPVAAIAGGVAAAVALVALLAGLLLAKRSGRLEGCAGGNANGKLLPHHEASMAASEISRKGTLNFLRLPEGAGAKLGVQEKPNKEFAKLASSIIDLHEGMSEEMRRAPVRLLLAKYVRSAAKLHCYEELSDIREPARGHMFVDVPYDKTTQKMWDATAVVSWRWSASKPQELQPGYTPMDSGQMATLHSVMDSQPYVEYVWVDWSCVPQYGPGVMLEVARSKLFYARARLMPVLPCVRPLPHGELRVVISGVLRALDRMPSSKVVTAASSTLSNLLSKGKYAEFSYFGRVWTLAERMARHGRGEVLRNWLSLEIWLGMTLDALWGSTTPTMTSSAGMAHYWRFIFAGNAKDDSAAMRAVEELRVVRAHGSSMASDNVHDLLARLFVAAVEVWKTVGVEEALDVAWLKQYLLHEADNIYHSWDPRDGVFAIFTYFCWHLREDFAEAHRDLCRLADIPETDSRMFPYVTGEVPSTELLGAVESRKDGIAGDTEPSDVLLTVE
eukprot:jgi/Tetstr1/465120/TSEL_009843.t1